MGAAAGAIFAGIGAAAGASLNAIGWAVFTNLTLTGLTFTDANGAEWTVIEDEE